jgi:hypothetical protein
MRPTGLRALALLAFVAMSSGACTISTLGEIDDPSWTPPVVEVDDGPKGSATVADPASGVISMEAPKVAYSGQYELTSHVDLAGAGAFGDTVSPALVALSEFHENPAGTILDLLALYQIPVYTQVWNALPGFLKDALEGWLNQYLMFTLFDAVPAIDQAVQFVDDLATVTRNVEMITVLTLEPQNVAMGMRGRHELRALAFTFHGDRTVIEIPAVVTEITAAEVRALLRIPLLAGRGQPDGLFEVAPHSFQVPYGDMLMDAMKHWVFEPKGATNMASWLNVLINCPSVAEWMGNLCIGGCVKDLVSVTDMTNFCTGGLDLLGWLVETYVRSLKWELVDMRDMKCQMFDRGYDDTTGDFKIDALSECSWDTTITMNGMSRLVPVHFEGRRIGD